MAGARKCWEQFSHARHAWLDVKVKLTMAEPLVAAACEQMRLPLRSAGDASGRARLFAGRADTETPPLTEVVLATLAGTGRSALRRA